MAKKTQSHIRSLLKGISWRIIATMTTVSVVYGVTCAYGNCQLSDAMKIGASEFFIKLFVYYIHERLWQNALDEDGQWSEKTRVYKTLSWRVTASLTTFGLTYLILGHAAEEGSQIIGAQASIILFFEFVSKLFLYYYHDLIWSRVQFGTIRRLFGMKR